MKWVANEWWRAKSVKTLKKRIRFKDNSKTVRYIINKVFTEIDEIIRDDTGKIEVNNDLLKVISKIAKKNDTTEKIVLNDI